MTERFWDIEGIGDDYVVRLRGTIAEQKVPRTRLEFVMRGHWATTQQIDRMWAELNELGRASVSIPTPSARIVQIWL